MVENPAEERRGRRHGVVASPPLLLELARDALGKAEAEDEKWQDRFHELDLMKQRAGDEAGGHVA